MPTEIHPQVRDEILRRLQRVEEEHHVKVLFAIQSGSRAWGFESPNSDYDVRFIYRHEPSWYQAVDLEERRDVIEYPIVDDIDLNGWDVRKALRLFWKSNPTFVEWIQSPLVYWDRSQFRMEALQALEDVYAPERGIHHYLSMARTNFRTSLSEPMVRLKKYFYVLRPLLASKWIQQTGQAPPLEFERLLVMIQDRPDLLEAIARLLEEKRRATEKALAPAVPLLQEFIEASLQDPPQLPPSAKDRSCVTETLNRLFHQVLGEKL